MQILVADEVVDALIPIDHVGIAIPDRTSVANPASEPLRFGLAADSVNWLGPHSTWPGAGSLLAHEEPRDDFVKRIADDRELKVLIPDILAIKSRIVLAGMWLYQVEFFPPEPRCPTIPAGETCSRRA